MGVYIKGMEMPPVGRILIVFPSGRVLEVSADETQNIFREAQAVPAPPHGRLIDADALEYHADNVRDPMGRTEKTVMWKKIESAPTIIPASEEGEA